MIRTSRHCWKSELGWLRGQPSLWAGWLGFGGVCCVLLTTAEDGAGLTQTELGWGLGTAAPVLQVVSVVSIGPVHCTAQHSMNVRVFLA